MLRPQGRLSENHTLAKVVGVEFRERSEGSRGGAAFTVRLPLKRGTGGPVRGSADRSPGGW
jgi:hypothetical protein